MSRLSAGASHNAPTLYPRRYAACTLARVAQRRGYRSPIPSAITPVPTPLRGVRSIARRTATRQAPLRYGVSARTRVFAYFVYSAVPQIHVFRATCAGQEYVAINCG